MDELDRHGKRVRNKSMPKLRAQLRVQEQRKAINPVLVNPEEFRASLKR
ncbi:Sea24 [Erwinia tracheiphila PSU-1]|nr:Sea24 [Erwinia tracheiphila PSU-1]